MTDYTALAAAAETLRVLLDDHITKADQADLHGVPVDLRSPEELTRASVDTAVSLWLYRVAIQPDLLNRVPVPAGDGVREHHPLPLELCFLISALHGDAPTQLALTGRVLQVVNDHGRLRGDLLRGSLAGTDAELRLSLDATSLIEASDLWYSLQSPFRLAVPVRMQVVTVASHLPAVGGSRVTERRALVEQRS